jgi:hypothetical protein
MANSGTGAGGLQVKEDRAWQERFWTAQRVGWILMALFILAAIAGLTGMGGPRSSAKAELGGGTIQYPRITRWQADDQLQVRLAPGSPADVELTLSREFVQLFAISSIQPEPSDVHATPGGHRFSFETEPGDGQRVISLTVRASRPVFEQRVAASLGDTQPQRLTITVLP